MATLRQGRFTKEEIADIEQLVKDGMVATEIAKRLKRSIKSILERVSFIDAHKILDIRETEQWPILKGQFSKEEQDMFIYHWKEIISQFRDDVPHTEKMQIIDLIKVDIIMNRLLTQERQQKLDLEELRRLCDEEKEKSFADQDQNLIFNYERQIGFAMAAQTDVHKSFEVLLKDKKQMLSAMKATREQRIKRIEDSKETIVGWMRNLLLHPEERLQVGIDMEKMRLAVLEETARLSQWHKYEDGMLDQPFLNENTVMNDQGHRGAYDKEQEKEKDGS